MRAEPGRTILLTGLPSAGKTTVASAAATLLAAAGTRVEVLDGDVVRHEFWPELGLSPADRELNLARIGTLATLLARNGVVVLVAAIGPFTRARAALRDQHTGEGIDFSEVYVATPLRTCRERDVKGLYARQACGEISGLTGVDAVYEPPLAPDLSIDTSDEPVDVSANRLARFILESSATPGEGTIR
ncbi:adenylyl-sulfate kinase [Amycolatopsis samaneae]|uniref:Adenylyl-sulfate kinase n=1 Tax=Amycolatopsis samaneae TaxID=664691 RepID=A0ABW5GP81_9PSEU